MNEITSVEQLQALVGRPVQRVADKVRTVLDELDREWLARSPFVLIATADAHGACDVSPKGDPPGFALVLDGSTIAIPDRPGNRRVDGFHNLLANPQVGLLFLIPGRGDTLRINGHARLVTDAPFFDRMLVRGNRPQLALVVDIDEVFYHCAKAFLRSQLWQPESWEPEAMPSRPQIAQALERPEDSLDTLEEYYGAGYADGLYPTT